MGCFAVLLSWVQRCMGFPPPLRSLHRRNLRPPKTCDHSSSFRVVTSDGRFNVLRLGATTSPWQDLYHGMLMLSWPTFFGLIGLLYLGTNALFALAYLLGGNNIENARPGSFADAFFFSVQTMASIGYGAMYPTTLYANVLVTVEALVGLVGLAIATGLMFARFSRPTAKVMFSNVAVIAPYNGVPTLMFRSANQRQNRILEAQIRVSLMQDEITQENHAMRRFYDLELVRSQSPIFALSWTVMHPITPSSPLYGKTMADLMAVNAELVVMLTGLDETFSQTIHARHGFTPEEIRWNHQFVDIFCHTTGGCLAIDYRRFHSVFALDPSPDRSTAETGQDPNQDPSLVSDAVVLPPRLTQ